MIDMLNFVKTILKYIGVDGAIFYTTVARVLQSGTSIITIFFIAKFLNGAEQGFYYTFGSIIAIQVFFELGLNGIITQYVAHEVSHLQWNSEINLSGSERHLSRLSSILHLIIRWYIIISGILFCILLLTGLFFFKRYDTSGGTVTWILPWFIISSSTTLAFLLNPFLAFLEGLGKVKEVARMRLVQQIVSTLIIWTGLLLGTKLYASGIANTVGILFLFGIIYFNKYRQLLFKIWKSNITDRISYKEEIFPYQWKIALSWISGYFIFQLFNPVLFATEGPVIAGQTGMTLSVLNGIFSLSFSWMSTKIPLYSGLIAQKNYSDLDTIFNKTLKESVLINGLGLIAFITLVYGMRYFNIPLGDRFLPYFPLFLMMVPIFLNQYVSSWALYLRCHKQEPFLIPSIVGAICTCFSTVLFGKFFGVNGIMFGYCIITLTVGFLWGMFIFNQKKSEWHA